MRWDTLRARRLWLKDERPPGAWRLGVLDHPWLAGLADRIQAQWNRTINQPVTVEVLGANRYRPALARGELELFLDVVDLDDGSLQELWRRSLPDTRPPGRTASPRRPLAALEAALRGRLPYLPLLVNSHYLLLRKDAAPELMRRACPGCVPTDPPVTLRRRVRRPPPEQG